jgi:tetratricopeptide (TPR) repeat protein
MLFLTRRCLAIVLAGLSMAVLAYCQQKDSPLKSTELLALIAGSALSENVVHEITTRGVAFRSTDTYLSQLSDAGADALTLAALGKATVTVPPESSESKPSAALLQHLANAGKLMRAQQYQGAAQELDSALQSGGGPEAAFVMGELLRRQEQWPMSAAVFAQLVGQNPDFPEAHTKYSYSLYRMGDSEEGLRQAKAALARTPDNAEAHKNAGLALQVARKYDAAAAEYQEALRIKPDYQPVRYDFGLMLYEKGDLDGSIGEYKKAITLNPNEVAVHNNLGLAYHDKGDFVSAIREYREAKRLNPKDLQVRQNLGSSLISANLSAQAVVEFRELEAMAPDSAICHLCMAGALHGTGDLKGTVQELNKAAELDPSDPAPHIHLGEIHEEQNLFDAALAEYRLALQLDENSEEAHRNCGRVLLTLKNPGAAAQELKLAEDLNPSDAFTHELYGRALLGSRHPDSAIDEFKQALSLDPSQFQVQLELASVYEKKGDWATAIVLYRQAAATDATINAHGSAVRIDTPESHVEYKAAQNRLDAHLADLKAAGKSAEAASLEASIASMQASSGLSEKLNLAMQAAFEAHSKQQFDEARRDYGQAVDLAEKLQPHDQRLASALDYLGKEYLGQDFTKADEAFSHELKVVEELYGPQSPNVAGPLQSLGGSAFTQKNYAAAQKYYLRALEANEKGYGEMSTQVAMSLMPLAQMFYMRKQYDQAEPYLLRAVRIYDSPPLKGDNMAMMPVDALAHLYETWGKPEKAQPLEQRIITTIEGLYGPDSRFLVPVLTRQAQSLRSLGRRDDAAQIDKRIQTIQATASN